MAKRKKIKQIRRERERKMNNIATILAIPLSLGLGYALMGVKSALEYVSPENGRPDYEDASVSLFELPTQEHISQLSREQNISLPVTNPVPKRGKTIFIDAGHGMGNRKPGVYDPGAVHGGYEEADLTLMHSFEVGKLLEERGFNVVYSRRNNFEDVSLTERVTRAKEGGADAFVSMHCNSFTKPSAYGVRTFYYPESEEGMKLGRDIQISLEDELEKYVPGFSQEYEGLRPEKNLAVLRLSGEMPAVLLESGFMTNEKDLEYLTQRIPVLAKGVADGIEKYFNEKE